MSIAAVIENNHRSWSAATAQERDCEARHWWRNAESLTQQIVNRLPKQKQSDFPLYMANMQARLMGEYEAEKRRINNERTRFFCQLAEDCTDEEAERVEAVAEAALANLKLKYHSTLERQKVIMEKPSNVVPLRPELSSRAQQDLASAKLYTDQPDPAPKKPSNVIQSSAEFVRGFVPPEYLIDGMLQRRFCYSLTARGGVGKTAVAMRLTGHVATGTKLGSLDVEKGTVLYFAFENPTDIQMRWLGLSAQMGFDPETADVHFVTIGRMSELAGAIELEMHQKGLRPALVVVDTVAASFEGDNENDNTQMIAHARLLRSLTTLDGGPCVLMLAHPPKNAAEPDGLVPRGGSGFLNEIDGNIGLMRDDRLLGMQVVAKFRGVQFNPLHFELLTVNHPRLVDSKNRSIPTVVARPVDDVGAATREAEAGRDEDTLLREIDRRPGLSRRDVAKLLGWHDSKVGRFAKKLESAKLIVAERKGGWTLTERGQKELSALENAMIANLPKPPL